MVMPQFDARIFSVVLSYGSTQLTLDGGLDIRASGQKFTNALQDECTITISNLMRATRDQLATQLTPFNLNQARKSIAISAGRVSTGLFLLYQGDIVECTPSQPPNITLTIKSKTCQFYKYNIVAQAQNVTAPLSQIVKNVAASMGLGTRFEATDTTVNNYSFTGAAIKQVDKIGECGVVDAFIDGQTLVVKNKGVALENEVQAIGQNTGMVGVPELTEYGVRVRCLLSPSIKLGGAIQLTSVLNPLLNGLYTIYKLGFEVCSRDTAFYHIVEASKYDIRAGAIGGIESVGS
jgi:hypothetical protein